MKTYGLCVICKKTRASFGKIGTVKRLYCSLCKTDNEIPDLINLNVYKKCVVCEKKRAIYGIDDTKLYCSTCKKLQKNSHELIGRNTSKRRKCVSCKERNAYFKKIGEKKTLYCRRCLFLQENPQDFICTSKTCGCCRERRQQPFETFELDKNIPCMDFIKFLE